MPMFIGPVDRDAWGVYAESRPNDVIIGSGLPDIQKLSYVPVLNSRIVPFCQLSATLMRISKTLRLLGT